MDYKQYKDIVYRIIGAAMKVHSELCWGLLEPIYQEALHLELEDCGIKNVREQEVNCYYKNHLLDKKYRMDIVVDDIVIEIKAVKALIPAHRAQLFNYMRLTNHRLGLLINFGNSSLQGERYCYDPETNECYLLDSNMEVVPKEVDSDYEFDYSEDDKIE